MTDQGDLCENDGYDVSGFWINYIPHININIENVIVKITPFLGIWKLISHFQHDNNNIFIKELSSSSLQYTIVPSSRYPVYIRDSSTNENMLHMFHNYWIFSEKPLNYIKDNYTPYFNQLFSSLDFRRGYQGDNNENSLVLFNDRATTLLNVSGNRIDYYTFDRLFNFNENFNQNFSNNDGTPPEGKYDISNIFALFIQDNVTDIDITNFYQSSILQSNNIPIKSIHLPNLRVLYFDEDSKCKTISKNSFNSSLGNLQQLILPDRIQTIDDFAFRNSGKLKVVFFPNSITTLGQGCFQDCSSLRIINFDYDDTNLKIIPKNFCKGNIRLNSCILPRSVTDICDNAFENCENLIYFEFSLMDNIAYIGEAAFRGSGIKRISRAEDTAFFVGAGHTSTNRDISLTDIGIEAFANCDRLQMANLSSFSNLKALSERLFLDCTSLISIYLPPSVERIHEFAFKGCSGLRYLFYNLTNIFFQDMRMHHNFLHSRTLGYFLSDQKPIELGFPRKNPLHSSTHDNSGQIFKNELIEQFDQINRAANNYPNFLNTIEANAFHGTDFDTLLIPPTCRTFLDNCFKGSRIKNLIFLGSLPQPLSSIFLYDFNNISDNDNGRLNDDDYLSEIFIRLFPDIENPERSEVTHTVNNILNNAIRGFIRLFTNIENPERSEANGNVNNILDNIIMREGENADDYQVVKHIVYFSNRQITDTNNRTRDTVRFPWNRDSNFITRKHFDVKNPDNSRKSLARVFFHEINMNFISNDERGDLFGNIVLDDRRIDALSSIYDLTINNLIESVSGGGLDPYIAKLNRKQQFQSYYLNLSFNNIILMNLINSAENDSEINLSRSPEIPSIVRLIKRFDDRYYFNIPGDTNIGNSDLYLSSRELNLSQAITAELANDYDGNPEQVNNLTRKFNRIYNYFRGLQFMTKLFTGNQGSLVHYINVSYNEASGMIFTQGEIDNSWNHILVHYMNNVIYDTSYGAELRRIDLTIDSDTSLNSRNLNYRANLFELMGFPIRSNSIRRFLTTNDLIYTFDSSIDGQFNWFNDYIWLQLYGLYTDISNSLHIATRNFSETISEEQQNTIRSERDEAINGVADQIKNLFINDLGISDNSLTTSQHFHIINRFGLDFNTNNSLIAVLDICTNYYSESDNGRLFNYYTDPNGIGGNFSNDIERIISKFVNIQSLNRLTEIVRASHGRRAENSIIRMWESNNMIEESNSNRNEIINNFITKLILLTNLRSINIQRFRKIEQESINRIELNITEAFTQIQTEQTRVFDSVVSEITGLREDFKTKMERIAEANQIVTDEIDRTNSILDYIRSLLPTDLSYINPDQVLMRYSEFNNQLYWIMRAFWLTVTRNSPLTDNTTYQDLSDIITVDGAEGFIGISLEAEFQDPSGNCAFINSEKVFYDICGETNLDANGLLTTNIFFDFFHNIHRNINSTHPRHPQVSSLLETICGEDVNLLVNSISEELMRIYSRNTIDLPSIYQGIREIEDPSSSASWRLQSLQARLYGIVYNGLRAIERVDEIEHRFRMISRLIFLYSINEYSIDESHNFWYVVTRGYTSFNLAIFSAIEVVFFPGFTDNSVRIVNDGREMLTQAINHLNENVSTIPLEYRDRIQDLSNNLPGFLQEISANMLAANIDPSGRTPWHTRTTGQYDFLYQPNNNIITIDVSFWMGIMLIIDHHDMNEDISMTTNINTLMSFVVASLFFWKQDVSGINVWAGLIKSFIDISNADTAIGILNYNPPINFFQDNTANYYSLSQIAQSASAELISIQSTNISGGEGVRNIRQNCRNLYIMERLRLELAYRIFFSGRDLSDGIIINDGVQESIKNHFKANNIVSPYFDRFLSHNNNIIVFDLSRVQVPISSSENRSLFNVIAEPKNVEDITTNYYTMLPAENSCELRYLYCIPGELSGNIIKQNSLLRVINRSLYFYAISRLENMNRYQALYTLSGSSHETDLLSINLNPGVQNALYYFSIVPGNYLLPPNDPVYSTAHQLDGRLEWHIRSQGWYRIVRSFDNNIITNRVLSNLNQLVKVCFSLNTRNHITTYNIWGRDIYIAPPASPNRHKLFNGRFPEHYHSEWFRQFRGDMLLATDNAKYAYSENNDGDLASHNRSTEMLGYVMRNVGDLYPRTPVLAFPLQSINDVGCWYRMYRYDIELRQPPPSRPTAQTARDVNRSGFRNRQYGAYSYLDTLRNIRLRIIDPSSEDAIIPVVREVTDICENIHRLIKQYDRTILNGVEDEIAFRRTAVDIGELIRDLNTDDRKEAAFTSGDIYNLGKLSFFSPNGWIPINRGSRMFLDQDNFFKSIDDGGLTQKLVDLRTTITGSFEQLIITASGTFGDVMDSYNYLLSGLNLIITSQFVSTLNSILDNIGRNNIYTITFFEQIDTLNTNFQEIKRSVIGRIDERKNSIFSRSNVSPLAHGETFGPRENEQIFRDVYNLKMPINHAGYLWTAYLGYAGLLQNRFFNDDDDYWNISGININENLLRNIYLGETIYNNFTNFNYSNIFEDSDLDTSYARAIQVTEETGVGPSLNWYDFREFYVRELQNYLQLRNRFARLANRIPDIRAQVNDQIERISSSDGDGGGGTTTGGGTTNGGY